MRYGKKLVILFAMILAFSIYFFILLSENKKQIEILNGWVLHTHQVIEQITILQAATTELESEVRGFVITKNNSFIIDLDKDVKNIDTQFAILKTLTKDNPTQQSNVNSLLSLLKQKINYQYEILKRSKQSQQAALLLIANLKGEHLYSEIKGILLKMGKLESSLLKQRSLKHEQASRNRILYTAVFSIVGLAFLGIAFWQIYRESIKRKIAQDETHKSEAKYKGLIEKSSLVIFTTDLQGRFTYISQKGLELTGYQSEELIGRHFYSLVHEDQKNEIAKFYLRQYRHFIQDLVEDFEIVTKDNQPKVIQLSTVLLEENNKVVGFQSIAKDVTQVKYVESLIKESKIKLQQQQEEYNQRLQSVLNNIPMVLHIKDLEGRFVMVNKNFRDIFAMTDEMVIGKKNIEIPRFAKRAAFLEDIYNRVKNTGKPMEFEELLPTDEGDKNFLVTKFPLFDKDNEIFAISSVAKDITDITYQRHQLINARLKAEKAEQLQESFLANMSHEIRTPMNGIMGMTNMLLDTSLDSEQQEYAELIKKSSDALLILINDILDLSKIKAGRMELEAINFNLKETVQNILQPLKVSIKKNISLNYTFGDAVPDLVRGDSHKLFQILNNLISNAVKFTEKGEVNVDIDVVEANDEKIFIQFDVSDTGIGISEEHIKNIFESFTQAGNDTVRRFGGTGLGLAITKRLIELQGGTISVQSTPGVGSRFHFEIPYVIVDTKRSSLPIAKKVDLKPQEEGIENKKILIVEDNLVNQRVLTSVLQKLKLKWDIANNGKEAVDLLERKNVYDLIIMDLQMPVMDGFEAATHIRKKLKIKTPIIAMTASTLRNERIKCFEIGMNEYLAKPFSPNELIAHIHNLINPTETNEKEMENEQLLTEELYDLAYLQELDDNDYLIEMIELFFETTSEMLQEIQLTLKEKDWAYLGKVCHKLKSSVGPLQIHKMVKIASQMEENAKQNVNVDNLPFLGKELQRQYAIVKPMIEAELTKAKKISNGFVV